MKKFVATFLLTAVLVPALASPALADRGRDDRWYGRGPEQYRPIPHYRPVYDQGHWFHGRHGDRLGWWWIVGGLWNYYPVYPGAAYSYPYRAPVVMVPAQPVVEYRTYYYAN